MPMPSTEQDHIQEKRLGNVHHPMFFHVFLYTVSERNISRDYQRGKKTRRSCCRTGCCRWKVKLRSSCSALVTEFLASIKSKRKKSLVRTSIDTASALRLKKGDVLQAEGQTKREQKLILKGQRKILRLQ